MRRSVTEKRCIVYCLFSILDVSFLHAHSYRQLNPSRQLSRSYRPVAGHPLFCEGCRLFAHPGAAVAASGLCAGALLAAGRRGRGSSRHRIHRRQSAGAIGRQAACCSEGGTGVTDRPQAMPVRRRERCGVSRMIGRWPDDIRFEDADVPAEGFFKGADREVAGIWPESSLGTVGRIAGRR